VAGAEGLDHSLILVRGEPLDNHLLDMHGESTDQGRIIKLSVDEKIVRRENERCLIAMQGL